jgi:hypothetical protein
MNIVANFEHRASSSRGKHEGESSFALCDRLSRTRDNSQRQLPTDHDYAVPTREYQTDQSSLKLLRLLLALSSRKRKRQLQKHLHRFRRVDTVTPYQGNALSEPCRRSKFRVDGRQSGSWRLFSIVDKSLVQIAISLIDRDPRPDHRADCFQYVDLNKAAIRMMFCPRWRPTLL